jgi:hypothetical protein
MRLIVLFLPLFLYSSTLQISLISDTFKQSITQLIDKPYYLYKSEKIYANRAGILALKLGYLDICEVTHEELERWYDHFPKEHQEKKIKSYLLKSDLSILVTKKNKKRYYLLAKTKFVNNIIK